MSDDNDVEEDVGCEMEPKTVFLEVLSLGTAAGLYLLSQIFHRYQGPVSRPLVSSCDSYLPSLPLISPNIPRFHRGLNHNEIADRTHNGWMGYMDVAKNSILNTVPCEAFYQLTE